MGNVCCHEPAVTYPIRHNVLLHPEWRRFSGSIVLPTSPQSKCPWRQRRGGTGGNRSLGGAASSQGTSFAASSPTRSRRASVAAAPDPELEVASPRRAMPRVVPARGESRDTDSFRTQPAPEPAVHQSPSRNELPEQQKEHTRNDMFLSCHVNDRHQP
jgi:hypothetical protein